MYTFLIVLLLVSSLLLYLGLWEIFKTKPNRGNNRAIKVALDRVIKRNRLVISETDIYENRAIALDQKNSKIILVEHRNNVTWEKCLSLKELETCVVSKEMHYLTGSIQKVVVELNFSNSRGLVSFAFFDDTNDHVRELPARIKKATWWKKKIQRHVKRLTAGHNYYREGSLHPAQ